VWEQKGPNMLLTFSGVLGSRATANRHRIFAAARPTASKRYQRVKEMVKIKGEEKKKKRRRFQPLTDIEAEISLRAQAKGFAGEQLILMHV
jgi:hypothetical protein